MANHQQTAEALSADLYSGATLILLTEDGTLPERLTRAYAGMAFHAAALAPQLPAALGGRILAIHEVLTGGAQPGEALDPAAVEMAVGALSRPEQIRVAMDVADLADDLEAEHQAMRARSTPST